MSGPALAQAAPMVQQFTTTERPRERCLEKGPRSLSLRECLALILNSGPPKVGSLGLAEKLLERPGSGLEDGEKERVFFTAMEVSAAAHLGGISGLGPAGKARILAAFELGRRYALFRESRQREHLAPEKQTRQGLAHEALLKVSLALRNETQEWLGFVPCFRNGEVGGLCVVERGVRTHVNIEPMELFARVLAVRPQGFFLVHNHPSGHLTPSLPDREITERVDRLAQQLGIRLLGHWIVAPQGETQI